MPRLSHRSAVSLKNIHCRRGLVRWRVILSQFTRRPDAHIAARIKPSCICIITYKLLDKYKHGMFSHPPSDWALKYVFPCVCVWSQRGRRGREETHAQMCVLSLCQRSRAELWRRTEPSDPLRQHLEGFTECKSPELTLVILQFSWGTGNILFQKVPTVWHVLGKRTVNSLD